LIARIQLLPRRAQTGWRFGFAWADNMAGPSKVEFPGQKKQSVRMRGTKHANKETSEKMKKQLQHLLDTPYAHLPQLTWEGKNSWFASDPVSKTMKQLDKIIAKKNDVAWLTKRMMARSGDPVAKAFAGSLHAAHDEEVKMVGKFGSASFGSASFIRRGDGKQGYLAGLQNFNHLTLRMLPWENHAKKGMYFFTWKGGFVCTGKNPNPPAEWLADVLSRSRFNFVENEVDGRVVWVTEDLDATIVAEGENTDEGYIRMIFNHGPIVAISLIALESSTKKDSSFIHHLALSMLPPFLPSILTIDAKWTPVGWPQDEALPSAANKGIDKIIDAWQGLSMNEGMIAMAVRRTVLDSVDTGLVIGDNWVAGDSLQLIEEALSDVTGSDDERNLTSHVLFASVSDGPDDGEGLRIDARGGTSSRKAAALEIMNGASCGDILKNMWEKWGLEGLASLGIDGEEAEEIWQAQVNKPKPFGTFLKGLDSARKAAQDVAKFPTRRGTIGGPVGMIHDLLLTGLLDGPGKAEREATGRHADIDSAAAAWTWLLTVDRYRGQEWHFESNARDKAGAWLGATKELHKCGVALLKCEENEVESQREQWQQALQQLKTITGSA
jgi:hypothetical protein